MNASVFADSTDKSKLLGAGDDATSKKDERKKKAAGNHEINYYNTSNNHLVSIGHFWLSCL